MTPDIDVELPFTIATNNDELETNILDFDDAKYQQGLSDFNDKIGLVFDGTASKKLAKVIENKLIGGSVDA
jgi:CDP-glycerol glycerophosphotransferase